MHACHLTQHVQMVHKKQINILDNNKASESLCVHLKYNLKPIINYVYNDLILFNNNQ